MSIEKSVEPKKWVNSVGSVSNVNIVNGVERMCYQCEHMCEACETM